MNLKKIFDSAQVGDFVTAYGCGLKNDGGFADAVFSFVEYGGVRPCKCKIEKIISATMQEVLDGSYEANCGEGGSASDDVEDKEMWNYSKEELNTFYTLVTLVNISDVPGKYFYADREGYDYARYILLPEGWEKMFSDVIEKEQNKHNRWNAYEKAEEDASISMGWEIYNDIVSEFDGVLVKGGDFAKNMRALVKHYEGNVKFKFSKYRHYGYTLEFEDDAVAQDFYEKIEDLEYALTTIYLAPSETTHDGWTKSTDGVTQFYKDYNIELKGYSDDYNKGWRIDNNIKKDSDYNSHYKRRQKAYDKYGHQDFREQWRKKNPFDKFQVADSAMRRKLIRRR